ncbi:SdpI family protein [Glutamicibacter sp. JL.03c]|uniref:SdpI family protein n=1 Tax=Glutamicibacter sp. JL.03c TaxID=2984842 RepID=UPI0021F7FD34|nr:SdpI family protein [Glutamicibacter sp. JL.03c]UYQ77433.1 SdpI family protein [Glutamicibacter sp. JL.03c]
MDSTSTVSLMFGLLVLALTAGLLARMGADGRLPRNSSVGLKTRHTLASDEAWLAAHREASPTLKLSGITGWLFLISSAIFCFLQNFAAAFALAAIGFALVLVLMLRAASKGNKVAKRFSA